ncbi:hypothetical protein [Hahella sp. NBU794]|uniref:hypothetical protein n=1 Tax=Hahella sp. NBU794 TaxID=3422590 RepID=UPI003D6F562D
MEHIRQRLLEAMTVLREYGQITPYANEWLAEILDQPLAFAVETETLEEHNEGNLLPINSHKTGASNQPPTAEPLHMKVRKFCFDKA